MPPVFEDGDEARRRLERRLHDGPQQRVVALGLTLRLARSRLAQDPAGADALLEEALADLGRIGEDLRDLARALHPAVLDERGLEPALQGLAARAPGDVELVDVPAERLPAPVEAAAYWTVAAAVDAAGTERVEARMRREDRTLVVEVHGPAGIDPDSDPGLRHAARRVTELGGSLSAAGDAAVRADIPWSGTDVPADGAARLGT